MRRVGRDEEGIARVQREGRTVLDPHLDGAGQDVPDFLTGVHVPAGLDAGRDLGEHLDDLAPGNGGRQVL